MDEPGPYLDFEESIQAPGFGVFETHEGEVVLAMLIDGTANCGNPECKSSHPSPIMHIKLEPGVARNVARNIDELANEITARRN